MYTDQETKIQNNIQQHNQKLPMEWVGGETCHEINIHFMSKCWSASQAKGFRNYLIVPVCHIHGSFFQCSLHCLVGHLRAFEKSLFNMAFLDP